MAAHDQVIDLIEAGIKAEGARQNAIASNVANMNSPGYCRRDIRFAELLQKQIQKGVGIDFDKLQPEVYTPHITHVKANGNDVSLDVEVGEMIKNSLRHRTYMSLLKKKYTQIQAAISGQ